LYGSVSLLDRDVGPCPRRSIRVGKGIPAEHLSKLFEPFFTMKKNGMGLGLSAAYGIFKSHKAAMHVESEVNQGTTFIMDFEKVD